MTRARVFRAGIAALAAVLLVHAALQGFGAAAFWRPCAEVGFLSDACMYLQYEAPVPWWSWLAWLWPVEVAALIAAVVVAGRAVDGRAVAQRPVAHRGLVFAALVLVVICNMVTDYVITPAFNGGYTSADSPPGFGIFGAVGIGAAGIALALSVVLPTVVARVRASQPPVQQV